MGYQQKLLRSFLKKAGKTQRGIKYNASNIRDITEFQKSVPLSTYDTMQIDIEHCVQGQSDVIRPGRIPFFSKSSGTTATSKFIPITQEALQKNHYSVGRDVFASYLHARDDSSLFIGK